MESVMLEKPGCCSDFYSTESQLSASSVLTPATIMGIMEDVQPNPIHYWSIMGRDL